jgi:hypothetical protein
VKVRRLLVLPVVALVGVSLAGCDSKPGTAAVINGQKISESDLSKLIPAGGNGTGTARSFVLTYLVREQIFNAALRGRGVEPSDSDLTALHDSAISTVLVGQQVSGAAADDVVDKGIAQRGAKPAFRNSVVRSAELELMLANKLGAKSEAELLTEINKQKITVSVSRRFGGWDAATLTLKSLSKNDVPAFVTLDGPYPADAQAQQ